MDDEARRRRRGRRQLQNVSLQPAERGALLLMAERKTRGNVSAFVASLIVKAAREEFGRDWESEFVGNGIEKVA